MSQPPLTARLDDGGSLTLPRGEAESCGEGSSTDQLGRVRDTTPAAASLYHGESALLRPSPQSPDDPDSLSPALTATSAPALNVSEPPEDRSSGATSSVAGLPVVQQAHDSLTEGTPALVKTNKEIEHKEVEPHAAVIPPAPESPLVALHSTAVSTVLPTPETSSSSTSAPDHSAADAAEPTATEALPDSKMIFSHIHTFGSGAARRRVMASSNALTPYEADLTSKDRAKQKEAVKRYLLERVRTDWKWEWPQNESDQEGEEDATPEFQLLNIDETSVWRPRDEWLSDISEPEDNSHPLLAGSSTDNASDSAHLLKSSLPRSPFKFESPDTVGDTIGRNAIERKRRRQRRLAQEMAWNQGLQCFVRRRDAWTGARKVSRASKLGAARRTSPSLTGTDGSSSTAVEDLEDDEEWYDDVEVPIPRPLLPPNNVMRASITPAAYNTIYDKIIIQSLTPSCPMNLKDVTRSCVQGWKRDGEWPPRATPAENIAVLKKGRRKLSVAGILGFDKEKDRDKESGMKGEPIRPDASGGGIRKSLQRVLGLSRESSNAASGAEHSTGTGTGAGVATTSKVPDAESAAMI